MPHDLAGWLTIIGGLCFGLVVGWVTYRTIRYAPHGGLSDLSTVIGAVGGAAITALFPKESGAFGAYCIGLAIGFFAYLRTAKDPNAPAWMGGTSRPGPRDRDDDERLPKDA
jgi:NhaP-type Na+/H+ or K+/H+ antiporter